MRADIDSHRICVFKIQNIKFNGKKRKEKKLNDEQSCQRLHVLQCALLQVTHSADELCRALFKVLTVRSEKVSTPRKNIFQVRRSFQFICDKIQQPVYRRV